MHTFKTKSTAPTAAITAVCLLLLLSFNGFTQSKPGNETRQPSKDSMRDKRIPLNVDSIDRIGTLSVSDIGPGTDKSLSQVLQRLGGVFVKEDPAQPQLAALRIAGMGERYSQILLNGAPMHSFDPAGRKFLTDLIPVEAISNASVRKLSDGSIPANFAGGSVDIHTRDFPERNSFYIRAGAALSDGTTGKDFYGDGRNTWEWLGLPGAIRNIPAGFPTTRSQVSFDQKNPQEQVFLSQKLSNDLAPHHYGSSKPTDNILLGAERILSLKKGATLGLIFFAGHKRSQQIDDAIVQASPAVPTNPYPFAGDKPLIVSSSLDRNYRASSQLSGLATATLLYGRNKFSFRNIISNGFASTFIRRNELYKPDEDTMAHTGLRYLPTQRTYLNSQLSGTHGLGGDGKFKLEWQASYTWYRQQNPDQRNFLLRQDTANENKYQLAQPQSHLMQGNDQLSLNTLDPSFTNSGRQWKDFTDHHFFGTVDISVPFELFGQTQTLAGGVAVETQYRVLHSDLLLVEGPGYYTLDSLLAPSHYFPGGLNIQNYYINSPANLNFIYANSRANYQASMNLGSAWLQFQNVLTRSLFVNWGFRLESSSQLASNTRAVYSAGFKNPETSTLDENSRVSRSLVLPSIQLLFRPAVGLRLHAMYFETVNRPELQELTNSREYDAASFIVRTGNSNLAPSEIKTYHAGIDWQIAPGTSVSVAGFHKKIDQPIENILSRYSTSKGNLISIPNNVPPAVVKGLSAHVAVNLAFISSAPWLSYFSVFADGTLLHSEVSAGPVRSASTPSVLRHTLSGSPDHSANAALVLQHPRLPMLTLLYNFSGDYISTPGSGLSYTLPGGRSVLSVPDYRVKARSGMNAQISQKLLRSNLQIVAGVSNLLKGDYIEYQDLNGNKKFDKPLSITTHNGQGGFFQDGTDNTVLRIPQQRNYYLTISYLLK